MVVSFHRSLDNRAAPAENGMVKKVADGKTYPDAVSVLREPLNGVSKGGEHPLWSSAGN
jgi:hypothetical protein